MRTRKKGDVTEWTATASDSNQRRCRIVTRRRDSGKKVGGMTDRWLCSSSIVCSEGKEWCRVDEGPSDPASRSSNSSGDQQGNARPTTCHNVSGGEAMDRVALTPL